MFRNNINLISIQMYTQWFYKRELFPRGTYCYILSGEYKNDMHCSFEGFYLQQNPHTSSFYHLRHGNIKYILITHLYTCNQA